MIKRAGYLDHLDRKVWTDEKKGTLLVFMAQWPNKSFQAGVCRNNMLDLFWRIDECDNPYEVEKVWVSPAEWETLDSDLEPQWTTETLFTPLSVEECEKMEEQARD